jgi:hypothetical protein
MSLILPSFELIPGKFNVGSLFAQIPMDGSADLTVTRGSNATRFNASGNVQVMGSGIPRLDYYTSGGVTGCPALLVEPAGTNTFIESETLFTTHLVQDLTTSGYTNAIASPDGNVTAEKFVPNTTNGVHGIANGSSLAITSGTTYTLSLFVKSDGGPYNLISLTFDSSTAWGATRNCIFNASNGTNFSVPSGATMTSENYGNGWYRIRATLTAVGTVAASLYQYRIYVADASGNLSWAAPSGNTNGIFCWGAQLEASSVPTSYIPTAASPVTRGAETISKTGVSSLIGQTEGTIYMEVEQDPVNRDIFSLNTGTGNSIIFFKNGSNIVSARLYANSSTIFTLANAVATNGFVKIALAYKSGDSAMVVNAGTAQTSASSFTFASALSLVSLTPSWFTNAGFTKIRAIALYPTRLTDTQLALLTSPYTSYSSMASALSYTLG